MRNCLRSVDYYGRDFRSQSSLQRKLDTTSTSTITIFLQYLHLLLVLGQHADVLLLLMVFLLHDGALTLVQSYVLAYTKNIATTIILKLVKSFFHLAGSSRISH